MTHGVREVVFTRTQMLHFYFCICFKWCMNQNCATVYNLVTQSMQKMQQYNYILILILLYFN